MAVFFARQMIGSDFSTANLQKSSARSERPGMGERMKGNLFSLRWARFASVIATLILFGKGAAFAAPVQAAGGEANLKLPDLTQVQFLGLNGHSLLMFGPIFCILGMVTLTLVRGARSGVNAQRGRGFPMR